MPVPARSVLIRVEAMTQRKRGESHARVRDKDVLFDRISCCLTGNRLRLITASRPMPRTMRSAFAQVLDSRTDTGARRRFCHHE